MDAVGSALLLGLGRVGPLVLGVPALGWLGRLLLLGVWGALLGPLLLHELLVGGLLLVGALLPWAWLRSAARLLGPELQPTAGPLGRLAGLLAVTLFFALRGGPLTVAMLARSYELAPLGTLGTMPTAALLAATGKLPALALALALPVLAARIVAGLGLGLLGEVGAPGRRVAAGAAAPLSNLLLLLSLAGGIAAMAATWATHLRLAPLVPGG